MKTENLVPKSQPVPKTESVELKSVLTIAPKRQSYTALEYKGIESISDVIKFIGVHPAINGDLSLKIRKFTVKKGMFIIMSGNKLINVLEDLSNYDLLTKKS